MAQEQDKKKIFLGIAVLMGLLFTISLATLYLKSDHSPLRHICSCPLDSMMLDVLPVLATLSMMVGAGVYYFMSRKVETKDTSLKRNTGVLLGLLNKDERKAVERLVAGRGQALQAELSRLPEMNKVKSHRIIQRLRERGVLTIERHGKTNIIRLNDEMRDGLL